MADSIYAPRNSDNPKEPLAVEATNASDTPAPLDDDHQVNHANIPPNPHFTQPLLYISGLDPNVTDRELASTVFEKILPVRLKVNRDVDQGETVSGTVEFQTIAKAEKAYAIVRPPVKLRLSADENVKDPRPASKPRLIKQLPPHTDDAMVYDTFRPFGPLVRAHCILTNPAGVHTGFRGMASLEYYFEKDAQCAQDEMHCVEISGKTISVAIDSVQRKPSASAAPGSDFTTSASPFVPGRGMNASAPSFSPTPRTVSGGSSASVYATNNSNANQQPLGSVLPVPGSNLQYSPVAATYIDPCNLFCKNLDPNLSSNDLFTAFKKFGTIVSARVMRNEEGKSREFGFVSFTTAEEARKALHTMNNAMLGNKQVTVRLHEPKKMRQEKLAARFGSSTTTSESGMRSPSIGGGDELDVAASPKGASVSLLETKSLDKRNSNSYYQAAIANSDRGPLDEDQLSALTSVVRNEVLAGEFSRRVRELPTIAALQVDGIVTELVRLKLSDAVDALNDNVSLIQRVNQAKDKLNPQSPPQPSPSGMLGVPVQRSLSAISADNVSILSSAPASYKERERLVKAVISLVPAGGPVEDITDMLASLPKKERALCLFNPEFLKNKVDEAKEILDITEDDDQDIRGSPQSVKAVQSAAAITKHSNLAPSSLELNDNPSCQVASSATTYTLATLANLPATEIIKLANSTQGPASAGLPLPKADAKVVQETDEFIDSLAGKPIHDQKQKVGDLLFKKIRTLGIKGAPKITIALLDSEDLRALAHLMNSYEAVLKEKILQKVAAGTK